MIFVVITFYSLLLSIQVEYVNAYSIVDSKNKTRDLYNPQMNHDNSIISAEIHTTKDELAAGSESNSSVTNDQIALFNFKGGSFESYKAYKTFTEYKGKIYDVVGYSTLLSWYDSKIFFSILNGKSSNKKNIGKSVSPKLTIGAIDSLITHTDKKGIIKRGVKHIEGYSFDPLSEYYDEWIKLDNFKSIDMYKTLYNEDRAFTSFILGNREKQNQIVSNEKDILGDRDLGSNIASCANLKNCPISSSESTILEFDIYKSEKSIDFAIQIYNDEYKSSVILYRDCFENKFLPIIAPESQISMSQINPIFNSDGSKIAFLSRQNIKNSILYDLYVVDMFENQSHDCYKFRKEIKNANSTGFNYKLIDTNIMDEDYYNSGERDNFTSHCWHPNKNILFYIKSLPDVDSEPIYYYDFDSGISGKLAIPTENNKYISMSDDGEYLLFSFVGLTEKAQKNNFKFNNSDNIDILGDFGDNKIGVAKLIYD